MRPDGEVVWATVDSIFVPGRRGEGWFYAHILDITAKRAAQEAVARQARQQAAVAALGRFALEEQDLEAVMDRVAETVAATLGLELCEVLQITPRGTALRLVAGVGWPDGLVRRALVPVGPATQIGYTLEQEAPVVTPDVGEEQRFGFPSAFAEAGARAGITVPIVGGAGVWGVLGAHARAARAFAPDEADFLRAVANVISSAVDRSRVDEEVRHRAMHDPLTGLPNRALALDRLEGALARRRRDGRAVAVLLADLDQFKLVNDSMGHRAGDDLLVALAPRLHDAVRPADTVARLGGDEFLVVCEQLDGPHEAIRVAERVAQAINQPIVLAAGEHFITASIGIAVAEQRTTPTRPTCCATPTPRCTAPRSAAAAATSCSTTCCASACSTVCARRTSCAGASSRASCASSTSRSSSSPSGTVMRGRGARALAAPGARARRPRRVHLGRGGVRADRRARRLGARPRPAATARRGRSATRAPSRCSCA